MEIIHIILGKANPNRLNGVNKVVFQLATKQTEFGRDVAVWGITKNLNHDYGHRNFRTKLFKAKRNPFALHTSFKKSILSKRGKATFHLHGGWIPLYATLSIFLSKNEIPFVITPHGAYNTIAMRRSKWIKRLYFQLFEKSLLNKVARIHLIGESEIKGLGKIFRNDKFMLLPYGFECPKSNFIAQKKSDEFIIGFIGRLDIYTKGLDLLIESFKKFNKKEPKSKLWIIGDSDQRASLERKIRSLDLKDKVVLWGSKFGTEKIRLMQKMHIFAHPSRNEGLPVSVLEACILGLPCIVSNATNMASYINEMNAGISVSDENVEELTVSMISLNESHKNEQLYVLSKNARQMVREMFNWKTIVNQFDRLYQIQY